MTYQLTTKNIKSITLRVDKNGIVKVSAPRRVSKARIDDFVARHSDWILTKLRKIPKYADNEVVCYFDSRYILRIEKSAKNDIKELENVLQERVLEIRLKEISNENIKKMLFKWYKRKSQSLIDSVISRYKSAIKREVAKITFREMTTKWGSCNYRFARISLNIALFSKPQICFEYVLLHELVHLVHPNHGEGFYAMLDSLMPQWQSAKNLLKE